MPFTISHAAAAAVFQPLLRRGHDHMPALVIGTIVPDFEYFLRLQPLSLWSHSLTGLVVFCLPVGLVSLALWELLIEDVVRELLELPRVSTRNARSLRHVIAAAAWIVLGAASHILWDSFTHNDRWGTRLVPALHPPLNKPLTQE